MQNFFVRHFVRQRISITREYVDEGNHSFMALRLNKLCEFADREQWARVPLRGTRPGNVQVLIKGNRTLPELWVRHTYRGYRQAFGRFLAEYHGLPSGKIPPEWHVDHLCSRLLFRGGHPEHFIRMILIPSSFNTAFGAGYEKMLYTRERQRDIRNVYHLDYITFLKVRAVRLPSSTATASEWAAWAERTAQMLVRRRIDDLEQAYRGMTMMLRLGYKGTWQPLPLTPSIAEVVREKERAYEAAPKVFILIVRDFKRAPAMLGTYSSLFEAKQAAYKRVPPFLWRSHSNGECSAWDETVSPHIEYTIRPVRVDSADLTEMIADFSAVGTDPVEHDPESAA